MMCKLIDSDARKMIELSFTSSWSYQALVNRTLIWFLRCGSIIALALLCQKAFISRIRLQDEKDQYDRIYRRKLINLASVCTAIFLICLWYGRPLYLLNQPNIHLTGDAIVSSRTLNSLEAVREDWQVPGVGIALVRMERDRKWRKQTIGFGKMNAKRHQVTDTLCGPDRRDVSYQTCVDKWSFARPSSALRRTQSSSPRSLRVSPCLGLIWHGKCPFTRSYLP